jgi:hypothetical protein
LDIILTQRLGNGKTSYEDFWNTGKERMGRGARRKAQGTRPITKEEDSRRRLRLCRAKGDRMKTERKARSKSMSLTAEFTRIP